MANYICTAQEALAARPVWLAWSDLTPEERELAAESYVHLRLQEDPAHPVDPSGVEVCRFERCPDGYIYVDL